MQVVVDERGMVENPIDARWKDFAVGTEVHYLQHTQAPGADERRLIIHDARDKSWLRPSHRLQHIEKRGVFAGRGRAGMLGLHFCPRRHLSPAEQVGRAIDC